MAQGTLRLLAQALLTTTPTLLYMADDSHTATITSAYVVNHDALIDHAFTLHHVPLGKVLGPGTLLYSEKPMAPHTTLTPRDFSGIVIEPNGSLYGAADADDVVTISVYGIES